MNLRTVSEDTKKQLNKKSKHNKQHKNIFAVMRDMCDHDWEKVEDEENTYICKRCKETINL